ncbi:tetratricopeptide repeat protein [Stenotrophomonas mori]|uniref:Tetratricopeptide repeat protein n=1 Tax=Stenotrophomonas mori TaxID=2871096 RepID=A0ABT0SKV9_9GAMM|nr:tetratricopeptide repeat protein [Stenotrophomonas mori]MCL7715761.1 tetratricopeptide repeat protein [Stenotrophomonas mori]
MRVTKGVLGGLLLAGLFCSVAWAQGVPRIAEFYFEEDAAARPIQVLPPEQQDVVDQLMKLRERGRKAVEATAQLAGIASAEGRTELADKLYREALAAVAANSQLARGIRWNLGWSFYRHGDVESALQQWSQAAQAARGNVDWAPPTLALALWALGRRDEAVQWYAAAVRTEPDLWNDPARFPQLLPSWKDEERARLAEVQQAWAADPPAWP